MATYCLLIHLKKNSTISVGKLGNTDFKGGYYVYVGSALNSIDARIRRHLKDEKKLFWHVDYLLNSPEACVIQVILERSGEKWECGVASLIYERGIKMDKFGSSDCKCHSHLFYFENYTEAEKCVLNAFKGLNLDWEILK